MKYNPNKAYRQKLVGIPYPNPAMRRIELHDGSTITADPDMSPETFDALKRVVEILREQHSHKPTQEKGGAE